MPCPYIMMAKCLMTGVPADSGISFLATSRHSAPGASHLVADAWKRAAKALRGHDVWGAQNKAWNSAPQQREAISGCRADLREAVRLLWAVRTRQPGAPEWL